MAAITQLWPYGGPGRRYGAFEKLPVEVGEPDLTGELVHLRTDDRLIVMRVDTRPVLLRTETRRIVLREVG